MENQIKFFHCTVKVDFRDTDHGVEVVRSAIEAADVAQQTPFLSLRESEIDPLENHPRLVRASLLVFRKFLKLARYLKARWNGRS